MTMGDNDRFDEVMEMILHDAMMDGEIMESKLVKSPAIMRLCWAITGQAPGVEDDLRARFAATEGDEPDQFLPETVLGLVHIAYDYGFRSGRIFQARDYGVAVPGESPPYLPPT
jgi:hypothetical protein